MKVLHISRRALALPIFLVLALCAPATARGEGVVIGDQGTKGGWKPPAQIREMEENYRMLRQRPKGDIRQVKVEPILDPMGSQLVGIVENRTLNKPQMDLRVNLALQLQNLPAPADEREAKDRRYGLENRIVDAWSKATALAVLAERLGYKATPAEIDQALRDLSAQSDLDPSRATQQASLLGIPDSELRRELLDGLIVEKMLREQVQTFKDEDLKKIFDRDPGFFLTPTRVKAWHLLAVLINSPTDDQVRAIESDMNKYLKRLKKCSKQQDFEALQKEIGTDKGIVLTFLNDVGADEPLKAPVIKALFGMKPGSTSGIFPTPEKPNKPTELHAIKVLERTEGHKGTFAEAKPQVQNFMIEKLKDFVYEGLLNKYDIRTDPAGLNNYIEVGRIAAPGQAPAQAPAQGSPAAQPTPAIRLQSPQAPSLPGSRAGALGEPPPVETIVGTKAERPQPGTRKPTLTPEAQKALEEMTARGQLTAGAQAMLTQDMGTTLTIPAAPAGEMISPLAPVPAPAAPPAAQPRTSSRRGRPQHNYEAAPPSVDEVLSRRARENKR